jgi:O-antigen ligase
VRVAPVLDQPVPAALVRFPLWTLLSMVFVLSLAVGMVLVGGFDQVDAAVKGILLLAVGTVAGVLVWYRPVLFPLSLYFLAIPFDALLQTGGGTITRFLGIATVGVTALMLIDQRRQISAAPAFGTWALYIAWAIASMMWSIDAVIGWSTLMIVLQLFAMYALIALLRVRPEELRFLAATIVVGGLASAVVGIYMFANGSGVYGGPKSGGTRMVISTSSTTSINADYYAAALVLPVALSIVASLSLRWPTKVAGLTSLIVSLYAIALSGTRGATIAVGVVVLYLLIMHPRRLQLLIFSAAGAVATLPVVPILWARFTDPTQAEAGGRFDLWRVAFDVFRHHWLYGVGFGQFKLGYAESYLQVVPSGPMIHRWGEDSHNLIANTSVELGIVGLVLVLAAWYFQWRATSVVRPTSSLYELRLGVEAAILGLFVAGMTVDQMAFKYVWLAFMLSALVRNAAKSAPEALRAPVASRASVRREPISA